MKKDEIRKRVAIYIRVSSDEQKKEGLSLEAQRKRLMDYCEYKGWWVFKHYEDAGKSGKSIQGRPAFMEMLEHAKQGKFSGILVTKFDRAFRNVKEALTLLDDLRKQKVDFISITENIDTTTPMGKAMFTMISTFAELERGLTGDRNKDIMRNKFMQGIIPGKPPFGYRWNKDKGQIQIDKKKADIVKTIFTLVYGGKSIQETSKELNVHYQRVKNMIQNKVYMGIISFDGEEKEGTHEPLISKELWEKINNIPKT